MGYCKLECPDGETECCICCTKMILASANVMIWTVMNMQKIAKIMLRRMSHDYILIRTYTRNHSRSGRSCMRSDHVR